MLTLSNGFKKPETGDKGRTVFDAIGDNFTQLNSHTHNGVDSEPIAASAITKGTVAVDATSWVSHADSGLYRKSFTFPGTHTHGSAAIRCFFDGGTFDGLECFPTIEKINSTTAYIYSLVDDQAFSLVFS